MSSVPCNGPWEQAGAAQDPVAWFPPRNGESTCASRRLPSIAAENQCDHTCNSSQILREEGNTLWFMINSKLAGGAKLFFPLISRPSEPPSHRTRCLKLVDGYSSLKITLTPLEFNG